MGTMGPRLRIGCWSQEMNSEYFQRRDRHAGPLPIYPTDCSNAALRLSREPGRSDQHNDVLDLSLETACSSCVDYMRGYKGYKGACHMQAGLSDCFDGAHRSPGA